MGNTMRRYTVAVMSTRRTDKRNAASRPWQRRQSHDHVMWLSCGALTLSAALVWVIFKPPSVHLKGRNGDLSPLSQSDRELPSRDQASPPNEKNLPRDESIDQQTEEMESLTWWIDSAPLPDPSLLGACLTRVDQVSPTILPQEQGFSILVNGRNRPQTIYERREKIWVKTPPLSTPHQQAYDHLVLISCLQTPGATLHDPYLVRQWGGDRWPMRSLKNENVSLEDLFVIRSQGEQHFTYGLKRLGLPELGLATESGEARLWLKRLALHWLLEPKSRERLASPQNVFTLNDKTLQMKVGHSFERWLGPTETMVIADREGSLLSTSALSELFTSPKMNSKTKGRDQGSKKSRRERDLKLKKAKKRRAKKKRRQRRKGRTQQEDRKVHPKLKYR